MKSNLMISYGQYSDKGLKAQNQDSHALFIPKLAQRKLKGIAVAIADGISTSSVSQIASQTAVTRFIDDYYCTSDTWTTQTSGTRVIESINGALHALTRESEYRYNKDKGFVCTFSGIILKHKHAHLFHVGDARVYRLRDGSLDLLTKDHRSWTSSKESYLSRALGVNPNIEIDYQPIELAEGDCFILCTDGLYEFCSHAEIIHIIQHHHNDLHVAANQLAAKALEQGSDDNTTVQIIRIDQLSNEQHVSFDHDFTDLTLPPLMSCGDTIDGFLIQRQIHATSRSHVYLATDETDKQTVVIKIPSIDLRQDPTYLERFQIEEWVARRINNTHVLKAPPQRRKRNYLYSVTEYIEGTTLHQWLLDHPAPSLDTVRGIIEQIAEGLQAMHRLEILHQDLRLNNVMIDLNGTVKIIDFGGVKVAGIAEANEVSQASEMQGTALFMAPEYFVGEQISDRSDQFSLAVIAYHMLCGRFPYATNVAKARTVAAQKRLKYQSVLDDEREIPGWIDLTLRKALHPNPFKRYDVLSEFVHDLRYPNSTYLTQNRPPLIERSPVAFWRGLSTLLGVIILYLVYYIQTLTN